MTPLYVDADGPLRGLVIDSTDYMEIGPGEYTPPVFNAGVLKEALRVWVRDLLEDIPAETPRETILCVSDPSSTYWRHEVLPEYKSGRTITHHHIAWLMGRKVLFRSPQDWLPEGVSLWKAPKMEADDLVAIGMTQGGTGYSNDKDLLTVPGQLWYRREPTIRTIPEADALKAFLHQVLIGDSCDGVPGCPGVGPKKAEGILTGPTRKDWWKAIVAAYEKADGGSEELAIRYAQVLRMKRSLDEPLWSPKVDGLV
jgi:DNA polymerase-1